MTHTTPRGLLRFNASDERDAAEALRGVCASRSWAAALVAGRPYGTLDALLAASDAAVSHLDAGGLAEAVAGHPPIGRPEQGGAASVREQGGVRPEQRGELLELDRAYRERHGHVFLICATGRTGEEMLAALRERIDNDAATEREIVRAELGRINRVRLTRLAEAEGDP